MASKLDEYKIPAWLCPICSSIVTVGFAQHISACRRHEAKRLRLARERQKLVEFLDAPRRYSTSPLDFVERINYGLYGLYGVRVGFSVCGLRWSDDLYATHVAPIGRRYGFNLPDGERKYSGYQAFYVFDDSALDKIRDRNHRHIFSCDYLRDFTGVHLGSGSLGIGLNWGEMFIDDFPRWDKTPGVYNFGGRRSR